MQWIERLGYRKADFIVSLLPNADRYINTVSKNPKKFHWISNGIQPDTSDNQPLSQVVADSLPNDKCIIAYTGTLGMANALEYLVDASILLKDDKRFHFLLVGDGYLKQSFLNKTLGNTNIQFIAKLPKQQIQGLLKRVDICFIGRSNTPLFDYGVASNKYFDYMLAKKPILEASNPIDSPAQRSGCGITVRPEDPVAIVEGILDLHAKCSKELQNLGDLGYHYVIKNHNFEYLSRKYLKLFNQKDAPI
jgi:glycosyltransferase involved in cell wall biosynthesis